MVLAQTKTPHGDSWRSLKGLGASGALATSMPRRRRPEAKAGVRMMKLRTLDGRSFG